MILPQESVLEKELTKTKSTRAKGKEIPSKKKIADQKQGAKEIPRAIPREKEESPHSETKKMERVQKTWYLPARPEGRIQAKVTRKTREKVVRKEKTTATRMAAKQKRVKSDLR